MLLMSAERVCDGSTVCLDNCPCIEHHVNDFYEDTVVDEGKDQEPSSYLERTIFWLLLPALRKTLIAASKWDVLRVQKSRFNGLDYLAEILWNYNPRRSKKYSPRLNVFAIPPFKEWLRQNPRPYYPLSWLWSENEAALYIQRYVRGWLVRKRSDVQEMRQFWKVSY
ncbi:IQ domain-containing protein K [Calliopsis andreniformis]|uniref:IQ domain-containing protein K n=1 Tax=Calliopsis andreniformis TaxID=337506 RepID=UPI003FCD228E